MNCRWGVWAHWTQWEMDLEPGGRPHVTRKAGVAFWVLWSWFQPWSSTHSFSDIWAVPCPWQGEWPWVLPMGDGRKNLYCPCRLWHRRVVTVGWQFSTHVLQECLKHVIPALAGVAQWTECRPVNRKVAGLLPSQAHTGLQARSPVGSMWEATNQWTSHLVMFLSLSFSLLSLLSKNK